MTEPAAPPASDSEVAPPPAPAAPPAAPPEPAAPPTDDAPPPPTDDVPPPADAPAPADAPPTDPRATARIIRERDEARGELSKRDETIAALEADYQRRAAADRAGAGGRERPETAEERQARYDANPLAFYDAEKRKEAQKGAARWLASQPEAGDTRETRDKFLDRVEDIARELNLTSDDPERDAKIALHFYKTRFPATPPPPTTGIRKDTLNPGAGGAPPPTVLSDAECDKHITELRQRDPDAADALWAKERHRRGWGD